MIDFEDPAVQAVLAEAARQGAAQAIGDIALYTKEQVCQMLGIAYNTLQRRIAEKKIRVVDGRVPGESIRRYLSEHPGNR